MNGLYSIKKKEKPELFDPWPEKYDQWFTTPIGALVKRYEVELILDLLNPRSGETVLDAGCGTGVFTLDILSFGTHVTGIDISLPMLLRAVKKSKEYSFQAVLADMSNLPFLDNAFDKVVSITALEFIADAKGAVEELFRVTRKGGYIVMATLNRLSSWADRRRAEAKKGHSLFKKAIFRSPDELLSMTPVNGVVRTAIHFGKDENPDHAPAIELEGQRKSFKTGAFVAARWQKP
jgi:ubiquinone/menaquinone biosynthesis C-methylase UbiE